MHQRTAITAGAALQESSITALSVKLLRQNLPQPFDLSLLNLGVTNFQQLGTPAGHTAINSFFKSSSDGAAVKRKRSHSHEASSDAVGSEQAASAPAQQDRAAAQDSGGGAAGHAGSEQPDGKKLCSARRDYGGAARQNVISKRAERQLMDARAGLAPAATPAAESGACMRMQHGPGEGAEPPRSSLAALQARSAGDLEAGNQVSEGVSVQQLAAAKSAPPVADASLAVATSEPCNAAPLQTLHALRQPAETPLGSAPHVQGTAWGPMPAASPAQTCAPPPARSAAIAAPARSAQALRAAAHPTAAAVRLPALPPTRGPSTAAAQGASSMHAYGSGTPAAAAPHTSSAHPGAADAAPVCVVDAGAAPVNTMPGSEILVQRQASRGSGPSAAAPHGYGDDHSAEAARCGDTDAAPLPLGVLSYGEAVLDDAVSDAGAPEDALPAQGAHDEGGVQHLSDSAPGRLAAARGHAAPPVLQHQQHAANAAAQAVSPTATKSASPGGDRMFDAPAAPESPDEPLTAPGCELLSQSQPLSTELSQRAGGSQEPGRQRVILHIDVDCFYCQACSCPASGGDQSRLVCLNGCTMHAERGLFWEMLCDQRSIVLQHLSNIQLWP